MTESFGRLDAALIRDLTACNHRTHATLDVTLLLEGTVQRDRNTLRVTVRLVQAARDSTMWAQLFHGPADSVLRQTTVVSGVAAAVAAIA